MLKLLAAALMLAMAPLTAPAAHATRAEQCRAIDCSGRHIECRRGNPVAKWRCEERKARWKARCEIDKRVCMTTAD